MDLTKYRLSDSIVVNVSADAAYAIVADITRMGELSPICKRAEWLDDEHTRFAGTNVVPQREWTTQCRVDVAEPGKEFTFTNLGTEGTNELVQWSYTFTASGDGAEAGEHWQVLPGYESYVHGLAPDADLEQILDDAIVRTKDSIAATLANLKAVAEG
jgi:hypothetical protein